MKKNKLVIKLIIATIAVGGLFFGGEYFARNILEKQVIASGKKELSEEERIAKEMEESRRWMEEVDNMSVKEYYKEATDINPETKEEELIWSRGAEIVSTFEEKFGLNSGNIKNKELSKEQFDYLHAVVSWYSLEDNPILKRNEADNVEYAEEMSLELNVSDIMAIAPNKETEKIIEDICKEAGVNPDGKVKDLTPVLIIEINDKLFEYEQTTHIHE